MKNYARELWLFSALLFLAAQLTQAAQAGSVEEYLKSFHENPARMMESLPQEIDGRGEAHFRGYINEREVRKSFRERKKIRRQLTKAGADLISTAPTEKDLPEMVVEPGVAVVRNIRSLEIWKSAKLENTPWADSYWPMYLGLTANRYADRAAPHAKDWNLNYSYYMSHLPGSIVDSGDPEAIDALSPAEKYDFVLGDRNFTLTQYSWKTGEQHFNEDGSVATWMGICHGWAGAAHMFAALPSRPVVVTAASGQAVTFYPQDVKALQSMLWANASPSTRFVGNRCNVAAPPKNSNGRILDSNCFDSNPATWHLITTNQLGGQKRSFVMDSTYDLQVWNFPMVGYKYRFFNPQTLRESNQLDAALVPIEKFSIDKFKEFRDPNAKYVIGVYMDATHVIEINPTRGKTQDPLRTVRFIYDLELDANFNVIGGEWYSNAHPDFIWTFDKGAQAMTIADSSLVNDTWDVSAPVPAAWADFARRASNRGAPLYSFISRLISGAPASEEPMSLAPLSDGRR